MASASVENPQAIPSTVKYQLEQANEDFTSDNEDIEMTTLIKREELNETSSASDEDDDSETGTSKRSPIKLLLMRTPWYIIGLVVLVTGVVLSQYTIHLPYEADCDDVYTDNYTNSTAPPSVTDGSINVSY